MKYLFIALLLIRFAGNASSQNPVADFETTIVYDCGYATIEFTNNSKNADTYLWDSYGTGTFTQTTLPKAISTSTDQSWTVTLIAKGNGTSDTISKKIEVIQTKVDYAMTLDEAKPYAPLSVKFVNQSVVRNGETMTFTWDFGDGEQSTEASPEHVYATPGTYYTTLKGRKNNDCELMASKFIIAKDTAQMGEFAYINTDCYNEYEVPPIAFGKHFEIKNDTLVAWGYLEGNCGAVKTATARYIRDTVFIRTWESGPLTTCNCGFGFEIKVPKVTKNPTVVLFNGEVYTAKTSTIDHIAERENTIALYPNPAQNHITVETGCTDGELDYQIIDAQGTVKQTGRLLTKQTIELDKQKVTAGLYLILLRTDSKIEFAKKIIVN